MSSFRMLPLKSKYVNVLDILWFRDNECDIWLTPFAVRPQWDRANLHKPFDTFAIGPARCIAPVEREMRMKWNLSFDVNHVQDYSSWLDFERIEGVWKEEGDSTVELFSVQCSCSPLYIPDINGNRRVSEHDIASLQEAKEWMVEIKQKHQLKKRKCGWHLKSSIVKTTTMYSRHYNSGMADKTAKSMNIILSIAEYSM